MNIAIFDIQHYEMVHVLHHVFNAPEHKISFFTNKNLLAKIHASELKDSTFSTVVLDDFKTIDDFFKSCYQHITTKKIDAVIFNTIDGDYKNTWKFIKQLEIPFFVTIHNINTWLKPPFTLNKKALGYYYYRKKIISKARGIIVQEELFIDYVRKNKLFNREIFALPHTLYEKEIHHKKNDKLVIAIPGAVDGHRRNYDLALTAIKKTCEKNANIQFVIIGEMVGHLGRKIFAEIEQLKKNGCDILHFYDKNSNAVFDEQMSACDIVFMPLNVETKYEGIKEIYGKTKVTGVLYDIMRFQKPGIVPSEMVIPPTMKSSVISYKDADDLVAILNDLQKNRSSLNDLIKNAKSNSEYYTKDNIRKRFMELFISTVNKPK